jgi:hypothetical protein
LAWTSFSGGGGGDRGKDGFLAGIVSQLEPGAHRGEDGGALVAVRDQRVDGIDHRLVFAVGLEAQRCQRRCRQQHCNLLHGASFVESARLLRGQRGHFDVGGVGEADIDQSGQFAGAFGRTEMRRIITILARLQRGLGRRGPLSRGVDPVAAHFEAVGIDPARRPGNAADTGDGGIFGLVIVVHDHIDAIEEGLGGGDHLLGMRLVTQMPGAASVAPAEGAEGDNPEAPRDRAILHGDSDRAGDHGHIGKGGCGFRHAPSLGGRLGAVLPPPA